MTEPLDALRGLAADGVVLRAFTDADAGPLARAFADPEIARWNAGPGSGDEAVRAWAAGRNDWDGGTHVSWAVADGSGSLVGSVSLHQIDVAQLGAEVGYWTAPWARGRGVATRAVRAATSTALTTLGLRRVELLHAVENGASCGVAQRCGFALEGVMRQSFRYPDGAFHDEHLHARLAGDP